jgi:LytS/YehU family sensor histidine kinase
MFQMLSVRVLTWAVNTLPAGVAVYISGVAIEHSTRYFVEAREGEVQMARLSALVADARLAALQSQLRPHFLFNSLNTIAVLVRDGEDRRATRVIEQLSEVLRQTLGRGGASEVALDDELELVRHYLGVEQARFPDRLRPTFDIDPGVLSAAVPSFAVQHLVENALRHGISRRSDAGRLSLRARRIDDALEVCVEDDGAGLAPGSSDYKGHGLDNTRERLRALYGERGVLEVRGMGQGQGTVARLRIPYREILLQPAGSAGA